jgi:hypothetical protein
MTYPGSWWEYSDGTIDTCLAWELLAIYDVVTDGNCVTIYENQCVMPYLNKVLSSGYNLAVSNELHVFPNGPNKETGFSRMLSETDGEIIYSHQTEEYGEGEYSYHIVSSKKNIGHLDSLEINGTQFYDIVCIQSQSYAYFWHAGQGPSSFINYYFAKEIGLVRQISISPYTGSDTTNLVNYYIEPY